MRTNSVDGSVSRHTNRVVELSPGIRHWVTNQSGATLVDSQPEILLTTNGIVARGAAHSALFSSNANTYAALRIRLPSGEVLASHFLGLAFHDVSSGSYVTFATVQDTPAELIAGTNGKPQVIYRSAFSGGIDGDLIYTYSQSGISQDIRFNTAPPSPSEYSLNPDTTHLIAITEVVSGPAPEKMIRTWTDGPETMRDEALTFAGSMRMVRGHAFKSRDSDPRRRIAVAKTYETLSGRKGTRAS